MASINGFHPYSLSFDRYFLYSSVPLSKEAGNIIRGSTIILLEHISVRLLLYSSKKETMNLSS